MKKKLALIIEDDMDASLIFSKALEEVGLQSEVIKSGSAALKRLAEVNPVIVLLDLHLPEVDGSKILDYIRASSHLSNTMVILVTADARMADYTSKDADLVLLKPTTYTQVRDFVSRLVLRQASLAEAGKQPAQPSEKK